MPKLKDATMEKGTIGGIQAFAFSGTKIERLGASEYTLVTVAVDRSGSTLPFADELRQTLITAVESCQKSPRANFLLLRLIIFSDSLPGGIEEIHGFKPLADIDTAAYPHFQPEGGTPLYDAAYSAIGASNAYAKKLMAQDFLVNGIVFVITDGADTGSRATTTMIKEELERGVVAEEIESLIAVGVGVNAQRYSSMLGLLKTEAGMRYIDAGEATKGKLAKLAGFVSQSVSSQSQSLGTGGPSQNISAVI